MDINEAPDTINESEPRTDWEAWASGFDEHELALYCAALRSKPRTRRVPKDRPQAAAARGEARRAR